MISIIIPTLNESEIIGETLSGLLAIEDDFEIIVSDGGSTDETSSIVKSFSDVKFIKSLDGRSIQMNNGAAVAKGDVFLFLHADTELPKGALSLIRDCLRDAEVVGGSFFIEFDSKRTMLKLYSLLSKVNSIFTTFGDQALFVRSEMFKTIDGFAQIPIMEDFDFQRRLRRIGNFVKLKQPVKTSARRFLKNGIITQQAKNVLLVLLFCLGVSPFFIKKLY